MRDIEANSNLIYLASDNNSSSAAPTKIDLNQQISFKDWETMCVQPWHIGTRLQLYDTNENKLKKGRIKDIGWMNGGWAIQFWSGSEDDDYQNYEWKILQYKLINSGKLCDYELVKWTGNDYIPRRPYGSLTQYTKFNLFDCVSVIYQRKKGHYQCYGIIDSFDEKSFMYHIQFGACTSGWGWLKEGENCIDRGA